MTPNWKRERPSIPRARDVGPVGTLRAPAARRPWLVRRGLSCVRTHASALRRVEAPSAEPVSIETRKSARCFGKRERSRGCDTRTSCRSTAWIATTGASVSGATSSRARRWRNCVATQGALGPREAALIGIDVCQGGRCGARRGISPPRHQGRQRDARGGRPDPADGFRTHARTRYRSEGERHACLHGAGVDVRANRRRSRATSTRSASCCSIC